MHRDTYPEYWRWSERVQDHAMLKGYLEASFGWRTQVMQGNPGPDADLRKLNNPRSLRNFPLQANGAEMLRIACIMAMEAGIKIAAPAHDPILIEDTADNIEASVAYMQAIMQKAAVLVLDGFPLRTDAQIVRYPDRYMDERGAYFWNMVWELIEELSGM